MNQLPWRQQSLSLLTGAIMLTMNLLLYLVWYVPGLNNLDNSLQQFGRSMVRSLSFEATAALYAEDRVALRGLLNRYIDEPLVFAARIDADPVSMELTATADSSIAKSGRIFQQPVLFRDALLGQASIEISEASLSQWRVQAISSWLLFNLASLLVIGAAILLRTQRQQQRWQAAWHTLSGRLPKPLPTFSGSPDAQLEQLLSTLQAPLAARSRVAAHLNAEAVTKADRTLEQLDGIEEAGVKEVVLVGLQIDHSPTLTSAELTQLWQRSEQLLLQIAELYKGVLLPDALTLGFGLAGNDDFAIDAICAARVLQLALTSPVSERQWPRFNITLTAGPGLIGKTRCYGLPLPRLISEAMTQLTQLRSMPASDRILLAESLLQYPSVNREVRVSLLRDLTLYDGSTLEVWELEALLTNDDLLTTQAQTLMAAEERPL